MICHRRYTQTWASLSLCISSHNVLDFLRFSGAAGAILACKTKLFMAKHAVQFPLKKLQSFCYPDLAWDKNGRRSGSVFAKREPRDTKAAMPPRRRRQRWASKSKTLEN
jgi:hypothetical protein